MTDVVHKDILQFEVAIDDARIVQVVQCKYQLGLHTTRSARHGLSSSSEIMQKIVRSRRDCVETSTNLRKSATLAQLVE